MEPTVSVSKGVFIFRNGFNKQKSKKKLRNIFDKLLVNLPWYEAYQRNWKLIESEIKDLHQRTYSILLNDIVNYISSFNGVNHTLEGVIPSATLLTGVNQPDHVSQFMTLIDKIRDEVTPHVAMINSQDASTLKQLVENTVWQLIYGIMDDSEDVLSSPTKKLKKSHYTMKVLNNWYDSKYRKNTPKNNRSITSNKSLVIIIPDFESFNSNVLQDFVMIVSSYTSTLPIVFVFGVATSVSALHKSFPYHVSSKLLIKVYHSLSSPEYMNQVLENIFLTHTSPIHLSGKAFGLLTDVFLFYDFSVSGIIQSIKYCMMDHYYGDNVKSLCCQRSEIEEALINLNADDLENIRQLLSFRPFVENQDSKTRINMFNDSFLKEVLYQELNRFHDYLYTFYMCVRVLHAFVKDMPKNILGNTVREIYSKCSLQSITLTEPFKDCMQLLSFQSQTKLVESITNAVKIINSALQGVSPVNPLRTNPSKNNVENIKLSAALGESFAKTVRVHLLTFVRQIENASTECTAVSNVAMDVDEYDSENLPKNRQNIKAKLLKATKMDKIQSEFEMVRSRFVTYLEEMFEKGLQPPQAQPFHEIFFFSDVSSVRKQIVGSPRGALHTALSNPAQYLQCSCCHLSSTESIVDSLPDLCLAYKLHRECGKHINLFDWLQAFSAVRSPPDDENEHEEQYDPALQLRFTRAVAELQFLGFIKSSKRKTDHVMRLTW